MIGRKAAGLIAGLTALNGTAALACEGRGCVYIPASSAYAVAPYAYAPPTAYGRERRACGACESAPPAASAAVFQPQEAAPISDAFFYGGLSGGAGPGLDVAGFGGGGGGFNDGLTGFSAADAAASALASAQARSSASSGASASASAVAVATTSISLTGAGYPQGGGWGPGGMPPAPKPPMPHGCGCSHHRR